MPIPRLTSEALTEAGFTMVTFAQHIGRHYTTVWRWVTGEVPTPEWVWMVLRGTVPQEDNKK